MKLKDSIIIILAVVIAITVGVFVGVKLTENKNKDVTNNGTNNNQEQSSNNSYDKEENNQQNNDDNVNKQLNDMYTFYGTVNDADKEGYTYNLNMEINILNDSEMTINSGDGMAEIEHTKGTYSITGNILTYSRKYVMFSSSNGKNWLNCIVNDDIDEDIFGCALEVSQTEQFLINNDNTLTLSKYKTLSRTFESFILH